MKNVEKTVELPPENLEISEDRMGKLKSLDTECEQTGHKFKELIWAVEQSSEGIATASLDGIFLFVNQRWAKMHGYKVNELIGKPIVILDSLADRNKFPKVWEEIQNKGFWRGELLRVRKDGSFFPAIMTSTLVKDDKGRPVCVMGTCVDINERKRAEEELKENRYHLEGVVEERTAELTAANERLQKEITERKYVQEELQKSEERYSSLFEDFPISLWEEDFSSVKQHIDSLRNKGIKDFRIYFEEHPEDVARCAGMVRIVDVNKATLSLYGAVSKQKFFEDLNKFFTEESYNKFREQLIAVAEDKTASESEAHNQTLTGKKIRVFLKWSVAPGYEKTYSKVFVSIIDITERKRVEETLRHRIELEKLVATISTNFINISPDRIDNAIDHSLELVGEFSGVDRSYIFQFHDNGKKMNNTHEWCKEGIGPQINILQGIPNEEDYPCFTEKIKRLEVIHVPDINELPPEAAIEKENFQILGIRSLILVPITYGQVLTGFLGFDSVRMKKTWAEEDIRLLKMVGEIFANALERKRTGEELIQRAHLAELGAEVGDALTQGDTLLRTLQQCAESMVKYLDAALARIWLLNQTEDVLELYASAGMYTHIDGEHSRIPVGMLKIGSIAKERKPHLTNNVIGDPMIHDQEWAKREKLIAFAGYPLVIEDRLVGVMAMFSHKLLSDFTLKGLESVADNIAVGIERKQAEYLIKESESKYKNLVELTTDIIYISDSGGNHIFMNDSGYSVLEATAEEVIGQPWSNWIHPDDRDRSFKKFKEMIEQGTDVLNFENRYVSSSGRIINVLHNVRVLRNEKGEIIGTHGIARDITGRKQAEEKLKLFSEVVEGAPDGVQIVDTNGFIVYSNNAVEKILGFTSEELIGRHVNEMNVDPEFAGKEILPSINETGGWVGELRAKHKDGREGGVPIWLTTSMVKNGKGEPIAMVGIIRDMTERKETEKKLGDAYTFLQSVIDGVAEPIMVIGTDYRVKLMNKAARKFSLNKPEESGYLTCYQVSHHRDTPCEGIKHPCPLEKVRELGKPLMVTHEHCQPDGEHRFFEILASPLRGLQGTFEGIIESSRDITERKKVEVALKKSEERYRSLFENSPISLWEEDSSEIKKYIDSLRTRGIRDFRKYFEDHPEEVERCTHMIKVLDVNRATLKLFKAASKEDLIDGLSSIFTEKSLNVLREELIDVAEGKTVFESEDVTRTLAGDEIQINLRWSLAPGSEESYSKRLVSIIDVTERKRMEEALRESERRFRKVFENAAVGIALVDFEGGPLVGNPALQEMLGYNEEELRSMIFAVFTHPDDIEKDTELFRELIAGERDFYQMEKRYIRKDGRMVWGQLTVSLIVDADGKPRFAVSMVDDITERKRAEVAIRKYSRELEESNSMKDLFTDIMSHDLLNPLNVVSGYVELLQEEEENDQKMTYLGSIKRNLERALDLTESATMLSKLGSTEYIEFEDLDLREIIERVIENLGPFAASAQMDIENNITRKMPASANTIIEEVFVNLISNAVKYAPEGKRIVIDSGDRDNFWCIKVIDFGKGIDNFYKGGIFERFRRKEKKGVKGSGLGLAIAKKIVDLHNGRIWVEDNPEGGAIFVVEVPKLV